MTRTPLRRARGSVPRIASAPFRRTVRTRDETGRARSSARPSVAYELTRARLDALPPQRQHGQRVALQRRRALRGATVHHAVERRDRVVRHVAQVLAQPSLDGRVEPLLGPARDLPTEPLLDEAADRDLRAHA